MVAYLRFLVEGIVVHDDRVEIQARSMNALAFMARAPEREPGDVDRPEAVLAKGGFGSKSVCLDVDLAVRRRCKPLKSRPLTTVTLDGGSGRRHASAMATVHQVIALAAELSEEDRRVVVDAIAPKESLEELALAWTAEIERRAARVRAGESKGRPANEVFARIEAKLGPR